MEKENVYVKSRIYGLVQGVWFRVSVKEKANELNITGEVKNMSDGSVQAIFCGSEDAVEDILEWCHNGPPLAKVNKVEVSYEQQNEDFNDFIISY